MHHKTTAPTSSRASASAPPPSRLLLRVHSAKQLHPFASSNGVYCKLYVGETAMLNGSQKSLFSKFSRSTDSTEDDGADERGSATHHIFRTRTVPAPADAESAALWDENFDVLVTDATKDILSVRVKCQHYLYRTTIGACAISLKQLKQGRMVDKWVPVVKGSREVATLRLQIVLSPLHDNPKSGERTKGVVQADIKTALAANQSADEAIERLLASATFKKSKARDDDDESHGEELCRGAQSPAAPHEHAPGTAAYSA